MHERADHDPHDGAYVHAERGWDDRSCGLQDGLRWPRHKVLGCAVEVQLDAGESKEEAGGGRAKAKIIQVHSSSNSSDAHAAVYRTEPALHVQSHAPSERYMVLCPVDTSVLQRVIC